MQRANFNKRENSTYTTDKLQANKIKRTFTSRKKLFLLQQTNKFKKN